DCDGGLDVAEDSREGDGGEEACARAHPVWILPRRGSGNEIGVDNPRRGGRMDWLTHDWHQMIPRPWCEIVLTLVAILCGLIVGAERERKDKPAGLRTMTLVSLGSCVFTMISSFMTAREGDPSRIASQIVPGIGFLGAGAILRGPLG